MALRSRPEPATAVRRRLLEFDPELGAGLSAEQLKLAQRHLTVPVYELERGPWEPRLDEPDPAHLGYMIVEGLMIRELEVAGARSIELLNFGDLLRPWLEDADSFVKARWQAIDPVKLIELDPPAASLIGRWPPIVSTLIDRGMRRSRSLAVAAALENIRGIDQRLWVLFWHLAERWGKRQPDGSVLLPLKLTHETLSILVGARRPTVTGALSVLAHRGMVERIARSGWRLRGDPPSPEDPEGDEAGGEALDA